MVEGVCKVRPVQMGVDAEHLAENHLADLEEFVGETRAAAEPVGLSGGAGEL